MTFSVSDTSVDTLLNILHYFCSMIHFVFGFAEINRILDTFPETIYKARKYIALDKDEFIKFIVCPNCHKLYSYEQAIEIINGIKCSKTCDYVRYPNHTQQRMR